MALQIYTFNLDIVEGRQEIDLDPVLNAFQSLCTSVSHPSPTKFRAYQQVAYCCFIKFSSMGSWDVGPMSQLRCCRLFYKCKLIHKGPRTASIEVGHDSGIDEARWGDCNIPNERHNREQLQCY